MRTLHLTTPVMHGSDVTHAQTLLAQRGYDPGKIDGQWGPQSVAAAVRAKKAIGYPARQCVGTFGNELDAYLTREKLPSRVMKLRAEARVNAAHKVLTVKQRLVQVALSQLGQTETPPNSNRSKFSLWYGEIGPWCAMFVSWCCAQTGLKFRQAYVPNVVAFARAEQNKLSVVASPADGDFVCYDWPPADGTADHIGIYASEALLGKLAAVALATAKKAYGPLNAGDFWAVEGNTAVGNESDGGEVMIRKRNRADVQAFVRIT